MSSVQRKASHSNRGTAPAGTGNSGSGVLDAQGVARHHAISMADRFKLSTNFSVTADEVRSISTYISSVGSGVGQQRAKELAVMEIKKCMVERGLDDVQVNAIWKAMTDFVSADIKNSAYVKIDEMLARYKQGDGFRVLPAEGAAVYKYLASLKDSAKPLAMGEMKEHLAHKGLQSGQVNFVWHALVHEVAKSSPASQRR